MHKVYLSLGGNLGDKPSNFKKTLEFTQKELGTPVKISSVYETPPWGFRAREKFWNQVIMIETQKSPEELLNKIQAIEKQFNRKRTPGIYLSREMDIDILYYDELSMMSDKLVIPHPQIEHRKFVLVPLTEIAPDLKHPISGLTSLKMLEDCRDECVIVKVHEMDMPNRPRVK